MLRPNQFLSDHSGAVTVDWVVLTAAVTGLGLATVGVVSQGIESTAGRIEESLAGQSISARFASAGEIFTSYKPISEKVYSVYSEHASSTKPEDIVKAIAEMTKKFEYVVADKDQHTSAEILDAVAAYANVLVVEQIDTTEIDAVFAQMQTDYAATFRK